MNPLDFLRCPIDPVRAACLKRERDQLVCAGCGVCFPVKNGIPVLIAAEATLPAEFSSISALPCQWRPRPQAPMRPIA